MLKYNIMVIKSLLSLIQEIEDSISATFSNIDDLFYIFLKTKIEKKHNTDAITECKKFKSFIVF